MVALLLLGIMRLLIIYASGEILLRWDAKASARPPLSSSHYGLQRQCCAWEADKRSAAASAPASRHRSLAGIQWLLYVGGAAAEEPDNKGKRYARQSRQKTPQTRIQYAPNPDGEINGQAPSFVAPAVLCTAS